MKKKFINHTNHPSANWSAAQLSAAEAYGAVEDIPFPAIEPAADTEEIRELVKENLKKILASEPAVVLCQGEFNYTFEMVERLKEIGVPVMAATSKRVVSVEIQADGSTKQISTFKFVRFREY